MKNSVRIISILLVLILTCTAFAPCTAVNAAVDPCAGIEQRIEYIKTVLVPGTNLRDYTSDRSDALSKIRACGELSSGKEAAQVCGEGWQCNAFAKYVFYNLFHCDPRSQQSVPLADAMPGDFVELQGHFGIYTGVKDGYVLLYGANNDNKDTIFYSEEDHYKISRVTKVYHANNYGEKNGEYKGADVSVQYAVGGDASISGRYFVYPTWLYPGYAGYDAFCGVISASLPISGVTVSVTDKAGAAVICKHWEPQISSGLLGDKYDEKVTVFVLQNRLPVSGAEFAALPEGEYVYRVSATCAAQKGLFGRLLGKNETTLIETALYVSKIPPETVSSAVQGTGAKCMSGNTVSVVASETLYDPSAVYAPGSYRIKANGGLISRESCSKASARLSSWPDGSIVEVTAVNGNWGFTSKGWICLNYTEPVSAAQNAGRARFAAGEYEVASAAGLNGRQGTGTDYPTVLTLQKGVRFNVSEVSGAWGFSPECKCWFNLNYAARVGDPAAQLPVPQTPVIKDGTPSELPVGEIVTLKWNAVAFADTYTARLTDAATGAEVQTQRALTGTEASFVLPYAGSFDLTVAAVNARAAGHETGVYGIDAKAPVEVVFRDWNGAVLSSQTVPYGKNATQPAAPSRTGYTFTGWSGSFARVRENTELTALYEKKLYTVRFLDYDGAVLDTQRVPFEESAHAPAYHTPTGYEFSGWSRGFDCIREDTDVTAVLQWTGAYPLQIDTVSKIVRNGQLYVTSAIVNNSPRAVSNATLIMALKTAENKFLASGSADFSVGAGQRVTVNLSVAYDGASTVGDLYVVQNNDQKIPLANALRVVVDQGTAWSQWSAAQPPATALQTQSRTEYSYRDKACTTSTASSLSGWQLRTDVTNPAVSYGAWSDWSPWQDAAVNGSDTCEVQSKQIWAGYSGWSAYGEWTDNYIAGSEYCDVETRNVAVSGSYWYFRYSTGEYASGGSDKPTSTYGRNYYEYQLDSRLTEPGTQGNYSRGYKYWYSSKYITVWELDPCERIEYKTQYRCRTRTDVYKTVFRYRTRAKTTTYFYWKWNDYTAWSTSVPAQNADREIRKRTVYRYISNTPKNVEDRSGELRTLTGAVNPQLFAGKQALLHVVSADGATQFLGQTQLDAAGAYSCSFKLKNEPTADTGDYRVFLSVESACAAVELAPIKAPDPVFTVVFKDYDGRILSTQQVRRGESGVLPASPRHDGLTFIKWNCSAANVQTDLTVTAVYAVKTFGVVFIDDLNGVRALQAFCYGDIIEFPDAATPEGYDFIGWSVPEGTPVTENLTVYAQYERKNFTVRFLHADGSVRCVQTVAYGDAAVEPAPEQREGEVFVRWEADGDPDFITRDLTVRPVYEYEENVETPTVNLQTGEYESLQTVTLSCGTENAEIWYTTDGTDPLASANGASAAVSGPQKAPGADALNGTLYTGPFTLDSSAVLTAVAVKEGMNGSGACEALYAVNTEETVRRRHLVTVHTDDGGFSFLVNENEPASLPAAVTEKTGFSLAGVFSDAACTRAYDLNTPVMQRLDLYVKHVRRNYTVRFLNADGECVSLQTVPFGESAVPPQPENREGFVFTGWQGGYAFVCADTDVRAAYLPENAVTRLTLSETAHPADPGERFTLTAAVSLGSGRQNGQVLWSSDDERVVTVDDNGVCRALKPGKATVFATAEDSGECAACVVTVAAPDPCAAGHGDADGDGICDACGASLGGVWPEEPEKPATNCVCGQYHTGPFAGIVKLFHKIVYLFKNLGR